ncbi:MAG: J domain-containing protein [Lactobacillales bacterium]|jgi:hypothetical protein|nr:J domain-containing protein [Lactobacillales bacterium]
MANFYEVLGVKNDATQAEIKSAFRDLVKIYHPDLRTGSEKRYKEIVEAYEALSGKAGKWEDGTWTEEDLAVQKEAVELAELDRRWKGLLGGWWDEVGVGLAGIGAWLFVVIFFEIDVIAVNTTGNPAFDWIGVPSAIALLVYGFGMFFVTYDEIPVWIGELSVWLWFAAGIAWAFINMFIWPFRAAWAAWEICKVKHDTGYTANPKVFDRLVGASGWIKGAMAVALGILIVAAVSLTILSRSMEFQDVDAADGSDEPDSVEVEYRANDSLSQMFDDFVDNSADAREVYVGQTMEITGKVSLIDKKKSEVSFFDYVDEVARLTVIKIPESELSNYKLYETYTFNVVCKDDSKFFMDKNLNTRNVKDGEEFVGVGIYFESVE